ncbi:MAG TPA: PilZ domain-containing protein [Holophaga sp.]|nr:PilZ domain-containing protein [Holophaga sp.]
MQNKTEPSIRNSVAIKEALRTVCEKGELLLLVTPYVRFESHFMRLDADQVHVAATMSREDAQYGLRSPDLRIRFPYGHQFFEAPTKLKGVGLVRGRQSLALSLPEIMNVDDYRASYRVERVGRLVASFNSRRYDLLMATVMNISTSGIRIFAQRDFEEGDVQVDDVIHIAVTVTPEININCKAKVRYVKDRVLGLEFRPRPDGELLDHFSRWVFQKQEEERILQGGRGDADASDAQAEAGPRAEGPSLVLVSSDPALEARLREPLKDLPAFHRVGPTVQALKDLAAAGRSLVVLHVPSITMDDRKRLRTLAETLGSRIPVLLLGTGEVDGAALFELGNEVKAVAVYSLGPTVSGFFPRLLQGILRKHFGEEPAGS